MLLRRNLSYAELINKAMMGDTQLGKLTDKQICVASLVYSAGMANLTKLSSEDFIALALYAYNNVDVTAEYKEPAGNA